MLSVLELPGYPWVVEAIWMPSFVDHLECVCCQQSWPVPSGNEPWLTCPDCGSMDGILDVKYDLERVQAAWERQSWRDRAPNHWRYRELLPLDDDRIPDDWQVGWTPLVEASRLAASLSVRRVQIKNDGRNATGSFKDRASSVGVAHALQIGAQTVACASTGNAASSLAGYAARAGLPAVIFVPASAPEPKLAQLSVYGATVVAVQGTYAEAYDLCATACSHFGWYNRNCAVNPVLVEGKKTAGLELAEQCSLQGDLPDWVSVGVGDGCTLAGIWKGLVQMKALGLVDRLPRMLGVQSSQVAPMEFALSHNQLPDPNQWKPTIADSIDVPVPRNWRKAVNAIRESEGAIVEVDDDQILSAMQDLGRMGVYAEPAAAAALAGARVAGDQGHLEPHDHIMLMVTGHGLKDTRAASRAGQPPLRVPPDWPTVSRMLTDLTQHNGTT